MVDVVDTTQTFTITPAVPPEGLGTISLITVNGIEVFPTLNPVEVLEGDSVAVDVRVFNNGAADILFATISMTPPLIPDQRTESGVIINPNFIYSTIFFFDMPAQGISLTVSGGHIE